MNPIMIVIVLIGVIGLWFLSSVIFIPLGKAINKIWHNAIDKIEGIEPETKEENDSDIKVRREE